MADYPENGLLPQRSDLPDSFVHRADGTPDDFVHDLVDWVMDLVATNQVIWTAILDGELVPPPGAHILEALVREEFAGISPQAEAEMYLHLRAGTVAIMEQLPDCNTCGSERVGEARYDVPVSSEARSVWAYMCPGCYRSLSAGRLGGRNGQYLMKRTEVPQDVSDALERARAYWRGKYHG